MEGLYNGAFNRIVARVRAEEVRHGVEHFSLPPLVSPLKSTEQSQDSSKYFALHSNGSSAVADAKARTLLEIPGSDCTSSSNSSDGGLSLTQSPISKGDSSAITPTSILKQTFSDMSPIPMRPALPDDVPSPGALDVPSSPTTSISPKPIIQKTKKSNPCPICNKNFDRRSNLNKHIRCVHMNLKPFQCDTCGTKFGQKSSLEKHRAVIHEKKKRFSCDICMSAFGQVGDLHVHTRTVHLKQRPFACELCSLTFGLRSHLNKHVRVVHQKIKPHACSTCGLKFGERHDLRKHERLHERRRAAQQQNALK